MGKGGLRTVFAGRRLCVGVSPGTHPARGPPGKGAVDERKRVRKRPADCTLEEHAAWQKQSDGQTAPPESIRAALFYQYQGIEPPDQGMVRLRRGLLVLLFG